MISFCACLGWDMHNLEGVRAIRGKAGGRDMRFQGRDAEMCIRDRKGWKGFEFGDHYDKMGIRSSSTAELIFNDVKVPKENLLGSLYRLSKRRRSSKDVPKGMQSLQRKVSADIKIFCVLWGYVCIFGTNVIYIT